MQRRHLIWLSALAGCTVTPTETVLSAAINDVEAIAVGFLGVLPQMGTIIGLSATVIAEIGAAVGNLQTLAAQIKLVTGTFAAQPIVQQVETEVNAVITMLAGLPLPPPVQIALQAASILLPLIESAVNLAVLPTVTARAERGRLTPEQARNVLRALARR